MVIRKDLMNQRTFLFISEAKRRLTNYSLKSLYSLLTNAHREMTLYLNILSYYRTIKNEISMENDCELLPIMLNRKTDRKRNSCIATISFTELCNTCYPHDLNELDKKI